MRLVLQEKLAFLDTAVDGRLDRKIDADVVGRKNADAVFAGIFGVVHRRVGVLEECGVVRAMIRVLRNANAHAQVGVVGRGVVGPGDCQQCLFDSRVRRGDVLPHQQQHEFVSAQSRQHIARC